jgi:hypothetical protein
MALAYEAAKARGLREIRDTQTIFTGPIWPGRYMLPLTVSLGNESSTKS